MDYNNLSHIATELEKIPFAHYSELEMSQTVRTHIRIDLQNQPRKLLNALKLLKDSVCFGIPVANSRSQNLMDHSMQQHEHVSLNSC